ncbi:MAG: hypothetical protein JWQ71_1789 [Pedosphaera sp.]|nr:hypothetical protein [Pedosphaera sp.]
MRKKRIISNCLWITLALTLLVLFVILVFPDHYPGSSSPAPTTFENVVIMALRVAFWPLLVAMPFSDNPPTFVMIALFLVTGLFWAFIIELLLLALRRKKAPVSN